jgi:two-component sensor histidine kinase
LIASELITNAVKHAFVDRPMGLIKVEMCKRSDGVLRLGIADNGVGRRQSSSTGTGSELVRALSLQLGARLIETSKPGHGCAVNVYLLG